MTEPGTGSDLQGVRTSAVLEGDTYKINGSKTFITNGQLANLIVVVCKTDKSKGAQGISSSMVETDEVTGFRRGRNLDKIGMDAQDTSELFFDDVVVPKDNLLGGQEGMGFFELMQELPQRAPDRGRGRRGCDGAGHAGNAGLHERPSGLRQAHLQLPEHPLHAGRMPGPADGLARHGRRGDGLAPQG